MTNLIVDIEAEELTLRSYGRAKPIPSARSGRPRGDSTTTMTTSPTDDRFTDFDESDFDATDVQPVDSDDLVDRPAFIQTSVSLKSAALARALTPVPIITADLAGLLLAGTTGVLVCHFATGAAHSDINPARAVALLPLMVLTYWFANLYPGVGVHPATELRQLTKLNATVFLAALAALSLSGAMVSWIVFFSTIWLAAAVTVPLFRTAARHFSARFGWWGIPTVVISSGATAVETIKTLLRRPHSGLRPCGIIDPSGNRTGDIRGIPYLSDIKGPAIGHYALVALPDASRDTLMKIVDVYRDRFSHLLLVSTRTGMPTLARDDRHYGGSLAGTELANKLLLPWHCLTKRAIDIGLVLAAAPAWLPVLAVLGLAVKLTSKGNIFYGQRRLGKNGDSFTAWKLRSMRSDSASILEQLLESDPQARQEWETDHKLKNDPRITAIGRFIRKTSLDELPQFGNVLKGEMSLVGPRPIVNDEVAKYGKIYRLYSQVPPGITGLWQISGRNNTTYEERVRLDDFYVRNWSPWLDIYVLARTVYTIVRRDGAY